MSCDDGKVWCHVSSDPRISDPSPFNQFSLSSNEMFGPHHVIPVPVLPLNSDLQAPGQNFVSGLSTRLQELNSLPPPAASVTPEPDLMEASSIGGIQNQNQQHCKYDLLSSVPRECQLWPLVFDLPVMMYSWNNLTIYYLCNQVQNFGPDPVSDPVSVQFVVLLIKVWRSSGRFWYISISPEPSQSQV